MKLVVGLAALAVVALLSGCAMVHAPVEGWLIIDEKGPVAVGDNSAMGSMVGMAEAQGILGVCTGDASIQTAAASKGIEKIHHVDSSSFTVLGIYSKYTTVVYGD